MDVSFRIHSYQRPILNLLQLLLFAPLFWLFIFQVFFIHILWILYSFRILCLLYIFYEQQSLYIITTFIIIVQLS